MAGVTDRTSSSHPPGPVKVHVTGSSRLGEAYIDTLRHASNFQLVENSNQAHVVLCMIEDVEDLACLAISKTNAAILSHCPTKNVELERECLEAGALGHLEGRIEPKVLVAWIRWAANRANELDSMMDHGLSIDFAAREVRWNGLNLGLPPREYEVFAYLANYPGRVIPRRQIEQHIWEGQLPPDSRTLDVRIANIRKVLVQAVGDEPGPNIETIEKIGYRLNLP